MGQNVVMLPYEHFIDTRMRVSSDGVSSCYIFQQSPHETQYCVLIG